MDEIKYIYSIIRYNTNVVTKFVLETNLINEEDGLLIKLTFTDELLKEIFGETFEDMILQTDAHDNIDMILIQDDCNDTIEYLTTGEFLEKLNEKEIFKFEIISKY